MAGYATPAWTNGAAPAISAAALQAMGQSIETAEHPYGVCSTAASTTAKTVTIDVSGTLALFTGLTVRVKFTNGNTAPSPTLNVNSTGAVSIMSRGTTNALFILAGQIVTLTYDGTSWLFTSADSLAYSVPMIGHGENLLDNAYFLSKDSVRGTSGYLPINQQGAATYSGVIQYTIDRWRATNSDTKVAVTANGGKGIVLSPLTSGATPYLLQQIPQYKIESLRGQTVTISVMTNAGLYFASTTIPTSDPSVNQIYADATYAHILCIAGSGGAPGTWCARLTSGANGTRDFYAVKLELGSVQSLVSEGEVTSIPDYSTELLKCQRYYQLYATESERPSMAADCRPVMRIDPTQTTITISGTTYYVNDANM